MYKASTRWMIRRSIRLLNDGRPGPAIAMFAKGGTLTFPGDNSWSRMYRTPRVEGDAQPTHVGRAEVAGFIRRYVGFGVQMEVEDILVNGPPWNLRAAARVHHSITDADGGVVYRNRAVLWVRTRWGRIVEQEDYEDTERVAGFDRYLSGTG